MANAVYDGTSAVPAFRRVSRRASIPVETVRIQAEIAEETERHIDYAKRFRTNEFVIHDRVDAISHATCGMAIDIGAKVIVVTSMSGHDGPDGLALPCTDGHRRYGDEQARVV